MTSENKLSINNNKLITRLLEDVKELKKTGISSNNNTLSRNNNNSFYLTSYGIFTMGLLGYLIYLFGTFIGIHPILMMTILFIITTCFSYFFNKRYTFRMRVYNRKLFIKYLISSFSAYLINFILLYYFSFINSLPHQIIMLIATILVGIYLFLLSRYFVFKK